MSSSYLLFSEQTSKEFIKEKTFLHNEQELIKKDTIEVLVQSIRRTADLRPPLVPDTIHVKNYKNIIYDLFAFACQVRFALAPVYMITNRLNINGIKTKDKMILINELSSIKKLIKIYIDVLSIKFAEASFIVYIHGLQYIPDNGQLFQMLSHNFKKATLGDRMLTSFFDYCALPPACYRISTAKELIRRGYFVPDDPQRSSTKSKKYFSLVITVTCPGFPSAPFGRGWQHVSRTKNAYHVMHLQNTPFLNVSPSHNGLAIANLL